MLNKIQNSKLKGKAHFKQSKLRRINKKTHLTIYPIKIKKLNDKKLNGHQNNKNNDKLQTVQKFLSIENVKKTNDESKKNYSNYKVDLLKKHFKRDTHEAILNDNILKDNYVNIKKLKKIIEFCQMVDYCQNYMKEMGNSNSRLFIFLCFLQFKLKDYKLSIN